MDKNRNHMTEQILKLTLEIIYLLTGEDYAPVNHSTPRVTRRSVSQKLGRSRWSQSLTMNSSSSQIEETKNNEKILTLTNKIIQLLTREVPIRYEDITVCFSMEEWEYVEGHKDLYKYVLMEDQEPDNSKDLNKKETKLQDDQGLPSVLCINTDVSDTQVKAGRKASKLRKSQKRRAKYSSKSKTKADAPKHIPEEDKPPEVSAINSQSSTNEDGNLPKDAINTLGSCLSTEIKPINVNCMPNDHTQGKHLASHAGQQLTCPEGISTGDYVDVKTSYPEDQSSISEPSMDTFAGTSSAQAQYLYTHIKEESVPTEADSYGSTQYQSNHQEELWQKANDTGTNIYTVGSPQYTPVDIKKESVLYEEENYLNSSIYSPADHMQIQYTPKQVKVEPISQEEGYELYIPTDCTQLLHTSTPVQAVNRLKDVAKTSKRFSVTKYRDWNKTPEKAPFVNHRTTQAEVDGMYICSTCEKSFTSHFGLVKHQAMHNGNKVSCPQCGKLFFYKSSLVIHQRIHTGEKLFACPVCNKCFTNNSNLVVHQRIHTGEKPFVCSQCGKRFGHKGHLNRHLRTHETEKSASNVEKYVNRLQNHWNSHKRNGWSHNIYDTGAYCMYDKSV